MNQSDEYDVQYYGTSFVVKSLWLLGSIRFYCEVSPFEGMLFESGEKSLSCWDRELYLWIRSGSVSIDDEIECFIFGSGADPSNCGFEDV